MSLFILTDSLQSFSDWPDPIRTLNLTRVSATLVHRNISSTCRSTFTGNPRRFTGGRILVLGTSPGLRRYMFGIKEIYPILIDGAWTRYESGRRVGVRSVIIPQDWVYTRIVCGLRVFSGPPGSAGTRNLTIHWSLRRRGNVKRQ